MATSATYGFDPRIDEFVAESSERSGLDPQALTGEHVRSIRRSIGLIFSAWSVRGQRQWKFEQTSNATSLAGTNFTLPQGTLDVQTVILRRNNRDTEMYPISREDYLLIPDKVTTGRPDRYFIDRLRDREVGTRVTLTYWPSGENATDLIIVNSWKQIEDGGAFSNSLDLPFRFEEAFATELTARICEKFNPEKYMEKRAIADREWSAARGDDEGSGDLVISVQYGAHGRR